MGRKFDTSDSIGGEATTCDAAGIYHCSVLHGHDGKTTRGKIDTCVSALLEIHAGTNPDQVGRQFHLHLWNASLTDNDKKREWSIKKQTAYGVAIGQINPSDLGDSVEVDFDDVGGAQLFIELEWNEYEKNGKTVRNLELAWANIYHVDDPRAKGFKRCEDAIGLIADFNRRKPEDFAAITGVKVEESSQSDTLTDDEINDL